MAIKKPTGKTKPVTKPKAKKPLAKTKPAYATPSKAKPKTPVVKKDVVKPKEVVQEAVAVVSEEPNKVVDGTISVQEALEASRKPDLVINYPWLN